MEIMRRMYSIENKMVIIHSAISKTAPYSSSIQPTLSNITKTTLARIAMSKTTSKSFPEGVSAS